jgi:hypothetical protein
MLTTKFKISIPVPLSVGQNYYTFLKIDLVTFAHPGLVVCEGGIQ